MRETVRVYVWPGALTVGAGVMGWLQEVPLFYWTVGVILAFAGATTGLLRFDEWRYRNSALHKLVFRDIRVTRIVGDDKRLVAVRLGFGLESAAIFPIQFKVEDLKTQFMGEYPPRKEYQTEEITIAARGQGWFDDHAIKIPSLEEGGHEGLIECRLKYGRPSRLDHVLTFKKKVFFHSNKKDGLKMVEWIDQ